MGRIQVLDRSVAERIAAGEVIERPASVVKELIENSLDAGAQEITIEVEGGGLRLLRVHDDGEGISPADAPLALVRFATSKIRDIRDLTTIGTFGFRGEALPSIAAVSRLELTTCTAETPVATRVRVTGGSPPEVSFAGAAPGTTVTVEDLFYNTPARRKFLKSPAREVALIAEAVGRQALPAPAVTFRLRHDGREILTLPRGPQEERLAQVLGRQLAAAMVVLEPSGRSPEITGWTVRPDGARPGRPLEYLFVNGRPIQNRMISRAVRQAYTELLPIGHAPAVVLMVRTAPGAVDVNIHPRKLEVRFDDEHRMFAAVTRAVRRTLLSRELVRTVPASRPLVPEGVTPGGWPGLLEPDGAATATSSASADRVGEADETAYVVHSNSALPAMRLLGQLHRTYLLAEAADGLILIDQHAAHERVLYERLLRDRGRAGGAQLLVVPAPVELTAEEAALLEEFIPAAAALGFELEPFGGRTLLVRAVPAALAARPAEELVRRALQAVGDPGKDDDSDTPGDAYEDLLRRLAIATACHTAVRAGDALALPQMHALVSDLGLTADPYTCFHGRPTLVRLPRESFDRWFLRR